MLDKFSYLSLTGNVGQGQLSQFNRQGWTRSVISVYQAMLDKVSYLSLTGNVGQDQLSQFNRQCCISSVISVL